jgi:hypothetical protein
MVQDLFQKLGNIGWQCGSSKLLGISDSREHFYLSVNVDTHASPKISNLKHDFMPQANRDKTPSNAMSIQPIDVVVHLFESRHFAHS